MKKIFTLLCAAMMCAGMVNAKLIFQESFDGKNGTVGQLSAGATNSEEFFDGFSYEETRWWTALGSSNYIKVAEGSLSYAGYQTTGLGNKAYLWSSGADDVRSFASQPITSGKAYMAAIINVEAVKQKADPDYILSLCDHANSYYLGRLYTKSVKDEGGNWIGFKMGVAKNNESANYLRYTEEVFDINTNILVVLEYEFVSGDNNDIVRLYVNPTKETSAATLECVQDTLTGGGMKQGAGNQKDAGIYGIFGAFLRQGTNTPKVYVDEIKVATAWADLWTEGGGEQPEDEGTVDNIAALKVYEQLMKGRTLKSQPIVTGVEMKNGAVEYITIQDESGAIYVDDNSGSNLLNGFNIGDRLDKLTAMMTQDQKNGFVVARISSTADLPTIVSEGNSVEPFEVSLAEAAKYGPAWIQLKGIEFASTDVKFAAKDYDIKQGEASAKLNVPAGCDIIGEDVPAKADVKALVVAGGESVKVQISASADVTNRVPKGGDETGIVTVSGERLEVRSRKAIINGQMVIIRENKVFNVLGTEL